MRGLAKGPSVPVAKDKAGKAGRAKSGVVGGGKAGAKAKPKPGGVGGRPKAKARAKTKQGGKEQAVPK